MPRDFLTELEIQDVAERYFHALDTSDGKLLATCFTDDVEARYHTGTPGEFGQKGIEAVVGYLVKNMGNYVVRSHARANTGVTMNADGTASAVTHALAILWKKDRIHFRGLRYQDELRRTEDGWKVFRRRHSPLWQFDADPAAPVVPAPALELAKAAQSGGR